MSHDAPKDTVLRDPDFRPERRRFVRSLAGAAAIPLVSGPTLGLATALERRSLSFRHTHTGETLAVVYFDAGRYVPDALERISWHLRDHRSGETLAIDTGLLDQLHQIAVVSGSKTPFQVISGYRSPATNARLRAKGGGVAKRSLHMQGKAIDVRLADVPTAQLRRVALDLRLGGVGFYPKSDFVHLDTGRFRTW